MYCAEEILIHVSSVEGIFFLMEVVKMMVSYSVVVLFLGVGGWVGGRGTWNCPQDISKVSVYVHYSHDCCHNEIRARYISPWG